MSGSYAAFNAKMLTAARRLGLRSACFHWPMLKTADRDVDPRVRKLLHEGLAESVVVGEEVQCKLVVVSHASVLDQLPDRRLNLRAEACMVILNQTAISESGRHAGFKNFLDNAHVAFGVIPTLAPASPAIGELLQTTTPNASNIREHDWTPLSDAERFLAMAMACVRPLPPEGRASGIELGEEADRI